MAEICSVRERGEGGSKMLSSFLALTHGTMELPSIEKEKTICEVCLRESSITLLNYQLT